MLAQILPGFRDFRTPLVTGTLWLIFFWLVCGMPVPTKDVSTGPMGLVNSLGDYLSPAALAGVLSFAAYVVGIILALDSKQATYVVGRITTRGLRKGFKFRTDEELRNELNKMKRRERNAAMRIRSGLLHTLVHDFMRKLARQIAENGNQHPDGDDEWEDMRTRLILNLEGEIPLLGTKLLEKNKELYDIFDRTRSEADFRLGISLPIMAISIQQSVVAFSSHLPQIGIMILLAGVATATILLIKGWNKVRESSATVLSMVHIGVITSDTLEQFEKTYTD